MSVRNLKNLIRLIVEEVLGEPDLSSEDERNPEDKRKDKSKDKEVEEQNTVASVAPGGLGPNMPLGVGPSYPASERRKKKKKKR